MEFDFLVIGGGIAGVSCVEQISLLAPDARIALMSSSDLIKAIVNFRKVATLLSDFDVEEKAASSLTADFPNVKVIQSALSALDTEKHIVTTSDGALIGYKKLCLCTGGKPKLISENPYVIGIRDTQSVQDFHEKLPNAKRVVIVGNGGIATELVYEIRNCKVVWVVRDSSISHTFFDAAAADFFLPIVMKKDLDRYGAAASPVKRIKYTVMNYEDPESKKTGKLPQQTFVVATRGEESRFGSGVSCAAGQRGGALGPDWSSGLEMKGIMKEHCRHVVVEYDCEVKAILSPTEYWKMMKGARKDEDWPVYVQLANGKVYGCDFVLSATGVIPASVELLQHFKFNISEDGGLLVDDQMRTNAPDIYAAGDVCSAGWKPSSHWFQMRLWSQARQMGAYAGQCMTAHYAGNEISMDFCFELFAHMTKFFGYKVVLLGKFNAQGLSGKHELLIRRTAGKEFIKVVLKSGRMQGAILIGETDLEETFENLILNQLDLTQYGESLLDPSIDIEDYFD
eukprot:m.55317 g.55317  ORF g.55317 m.55317 type:complete len:511 (+) comp34453_c0_seq3:214-1746(+)